MASFRKPPVTKQQKNPYINEIITNDTKFKGRGVIVPNRIFVGGICPKATVEDLGNLFGKYGCVTNIKIVSDQNGSSKGYGFVTFEKADDVSRLQGDAENLVINNRHLNIAPAIMKNPPYMGRYPDSIVMPFSSNLYFANGLSYQYPEGGHVYANNTYTPQVTVVPTVSDATAYYPTPYHGTALFYPVSPTTPQIVVGSHQPYSNYQPMHSNNSNYVYSSPAAPQTTSPPTTTGKTSSSSLGGGLPASTINASDMHVSPGTPLMTSMPPNMTSLPPPLPYPVTHPPQYYNGTVLPQFHGDMYYNMVHGTCYPMMATINGQDHYVPYYDVAETCNNNIPSEESNIEASNNNNNNSYPVNMSAQPLYQTEMSGKESVPPPNVNSSSSNNNSNSNANANETKTLIPLGPPPVTAAPEHVIPEHPYSAAENNVNSGTVTPQTPTLVQPPQSHVDYNSSTYIHRSSTAIIYPNPPMPQPNLFFNSVYMTEATSSSLGHQCPYSKNLSDQYVSDHLPKRDSKYTPKKFNTTPNKDTPPHIPKFPFLLNNNYPGFVNRNMKEKEFKNNGGGGGPKGVVDSKTSQRPPRNSSSNNNINNNNNHHQHHHHHHHLANNPLPKPRVFHNQNQYGGPPRSQRVDRNSQNMLSNMQYSRSGSAVMARQNSYDQVQPNPYDYANNYQGHPNYLKNLGYENHRRYGQGVNNGGYRGGNNKYEKTNGPVNEVVFTSYQKSTAEERPRKYAAQADESTTVPATAKELAAPTEPSSSPVNGNVQSQPPPSQQPQQLCAEMQKLAV